MVSEKERTRLIEHFKEKFKDTWDLVDIEMIIDSELNFKENFRILQEEFDKIEGESLKEQVKDYKEQMQMAEQQVNKQHQERREKNEPNILTDQTNVLVLGKTGSGKSAFGWQWAKKKADATGKEMFFFSHPRPEILTTLPFIVTNIPRLEMLYNLTDAVVIIDEASLYFDVTEKKINKQLRNIMKLGRQNNVDFIFIDHNSYFITRGLFSFIQVKVIKELNEGHWALERPHMAKLYESVAVFGKENFYIDSDYLKGYQSFEKPEWFTEELSTAFRAKTSKKDFFDMVKAPEPMHNNAPKVQEMRHAPTFVSGNALSVEEMRRKKAEV